MATGEDVYCTLVMNDGYLPGAAVLAKSLRDAGTQRKLACMIVQENLRQSSVEELQSLYNYVIPVPAISSPNVAALYLMRRPDLRHTFSKIHLWRFTQFRKIVYIDADVVALRAPDELFDTQEDFAAAPDVGFPSIFNTGVMVLSPDSGTYSALKDMANVGDSFDGADQGLINQYFEFKKWKLLSFTYNCTPNANYQYEPAYRYFKRNISLVHFIGQEKPWQKGRSVLTGASGAYQELLSRWWAVYDRHFRVSPDDYIQGLREPPSYITPRETHDDATNHQSYYATGYPVASTPPAPAPAPTPPHQTALPSQNLPEIVVEEPFTDPGERSQNINEGRIEPVPTRQARRFSAPHMEWDATRAAPPMESKPEAANFPTTTYEFSTDVTPYRPPKMEPRSLPAEVHYNFPKPRLDEKPRPIFPWEEREQTKPTRKFIEDELPPVPAILEPEPPVGDVAAGDELKSCSTDPASGTSMPPTANTWDLFDARSKNAWDGDVGIESYVRALSTHQRNRGKPSVPAITNKTSSGNTARGHMMTPSTEIKADELVSQVGKRRESLLLMDFPSAVERPSLPVTPAPVRRTFWGGNQTGFDDASMPQAEGVPRQQDWDPAAQLEQLRRSSLIKVDELKMPDNTAIPNRVMPESVTKVQSSVSPDEEASRSAATTQKPAPQSLAAAVPPEKVTEIATSTEANTRETTVKNTIQNWRWTGRAGSVGAGTAAAAATDAEIDSDSRVVELLDDGGMEQSLRENSQKGTWEAQQAGLLSSSSGREAQGSRLQKEHMSTQESSSSLQSSTTSSTFDTSARGSGLFGSIKAPEFERSSALRFVEDDDHGSGEES